MEPSSLRSQSTQLQSMAGFTAPAAIDGIEFVDFLCLAAQLLLLGAPFRNSNSIRSIHQLHWWTAAQVELNCSIHYEMFDWFEWIQLIDFFVFSSWRSRAAAAALNPPIKEKKSINLFIHQSPMEQQQQPPPIKQLFSLRKKKSEFDGWLRWTVPLGPRCSAKRNQIQSSFPILKRKEVELFDFTSRGAAVSIAIPFIIPFKNSKFFHSMNMQQLYWRQITVIILFNSINWFHEFNQSMKQKREIKFIWFVFLVELMGWMNEIELPPP